MVRSVVLAIGIVLPLLAPAAKSAECWSVTKIQGYSALSDEGYRFTEDRLRQPVVVCFYEQSGTATGTDTPLARFGTATLVGAVVRDGLELVETYQIDRLQGRMIYAKTRVSAREILPNVVLAFVGEAKRIAQ